MANLIIKPSTGGQLIIKDEGGDAAITVATGGATTFAEPATMSGTLGVTGNITLSGSANNLGNVATMILPTPSATALYPTGHVLQVVRYYTTAQSTLTKSGSDQLVNGMTKDITPKGANSDFLIHVRWAGEGQGAWDTTFNIEMGGTRVNSTGSGRTHGLSMATQTHAGEGTSENIDSTPEILNFTTLVPTSSVIGTDITFRLVVTGGSAVMYSNSSKNGSDEEFSSELIISEIKG